MNKITKQLVFILIISIVTSCGGGGITGYDINDQDDLKSIKSLVEENFGADKEIYRLSLNAKEHLTSKMGFISIDYLDNGVNYSQTYMEIQGADNLVEPKKGSQSDFFLKNAQGKVKIKDLNFDLIFEKFEEATKTIPEEFGDFELNRWSFDIDNDNNISAEFTIEAIKKGEGTSLENGQILTNYYEFPFTIDSENNLKYNQ
ncbi:hypothetical protein [Aquimarina sp. AU58]|uniref:hypothetical protein n=1 Tax=Aquimarina sp. AU58 TaxID=1874112 RepID=UPI000D6DDB62|nr:hypothetical protein [Aquimarina sp. AU58]